jgi:hypothetical protein
VACYCDAAEHGIETNQGDDQAGVSDSDEGPDDEDGQDADDRAKATPSHLRLRSVLKTSRPPRLASQRVVKHGPESGATEEREAPVI